MKGLLFICALLFVNISIAQTKLIRHKSHSGTNKNFNPDKVNGNFGLPDYLFNEVILEDKKSDYILTRKKTYTSHLLIYLLERKSKKKNDIQPLSNTIISININKENQEIEFIKSVEKLLVRKLKDLRATEN